ncbi:hypothetical protein D3C81_2230860 [compost metagenome]
MQNFVTGCTAEYDHGCQRLALHLVALDVPGDFAEPVGQPFALCLVGHHLVVVSPALQRKFEDFCAHRGPL